MPLPPRRTTMPRERPEPEEIPPGCARSTSRSHHQENPLVQCYLVFSILGLEVPPSSGPPPPPQDPVARGPCGTTSSSRRWWTTCRRRPTRVGTAAHHGPALGALKLGPRGRRHPCRHETRPPREERSVNRARGLPGAPRCPCAPAGRGRRTSRWPRPRPRRRAGGTAPSSVRNTFFS
jgi:hypothetical protein